MQSKSLLSNGIITLLQALVDLGLLTEEQLTQSIATKFNPIRIGFHEEGTAHPDIIAEDVLNVGVNPRCVSDKFSQSHEPCWQHQQHDNNNSEEQTVCQDRILLSKTFQNPLWSDHAMKCRSSRYGRRLYIGIAGGF